MTARCPNDPAHVNFVVDVVLREHWLVDRASTWIESVGESEVLAGPSPALVWTCADCEAVALLEGA